MPHIILKGPVDLPAFHHTFAPLKADSNGWILKVRSCYLSHENRNLLFDCTAVRSGFSQDFFIRADNKDSGTTIRVDPYMRIERNEGVHRIIAHLASLLIKANPGLALEKTNLPPEVVAEVPAS